MNKTTSVIIKTGFITGGLDILLASADAWFSSGVSPVRILQFIATVLLGDKVLQYSFGSALLGLAIHFFIAFFWTVLFFIIYNYYKKIVRVPFFQSVLYGLLIWLVMNLLVLPLTNAVKSNFQWFIVIKGIVTLIIAYGFPLVYFARKNYIGK